MSQEVVISSCFGSTIKPTGRRTPGGDIVPDGFAALGRLRVAGFGRFISTNGHKSKPN